MHTDFASVLQKTLAAELALREASAVAHRTDTITRNQANVLIGGPCGLEADIQSAQEATERMRAILKEIDASLQDTYDFLETL